MKAKKLIHEIGQIDDQLITEYDEAFDAVYNEKNDDASLQRTRLVKARSIGKNWHKLVIAAACIVLFAVAGLISADKLGLLQLPIRGGAQSGGAGANANFYMFYEGPVLPLSFLEAQADLTVERSTTYDFLPYTDTTETYEVDTIQGRKTQTFTSHRSEAKVEDRYLLYNDTDQDIMVRVAYPYAASLSELFEKTPRMLLNGHEIRPDIMPGQYSGGFTGAMGARATEQEQALNLLEIDSWLGYQKLLSDGSYLSEALAGKTDTDQPVIIYEFSDFNIESGEGQAPSLVVSYKAADDVKVLSYGFHGASYPGHGVYQQGFSLPDDNNQLVDQRFCLIVLGADISDMNTQGYGNMGWDKGTEMEIHTHVTRYETTLKAIFQELLIHHYSQYDSYFGLKGANSKEDPKAGSSWIKEEKQLELIFNAAYDYLHSFGALSARSVERYETGWLVDMFSEAATVGRIIYMNTTLTVPAGSTAELTVTFTQRGSHDFVYGKDNINDAKGYDLTTSLGSNIHFAEQKAAIVDHGLIEIVEQNFGFDLAQDIRTVVLDPDVAYYYMLIKKLADA